MKKIISIFAIAMICLTACDNGKLKQAEEKNLQLDSSLQEAKANQDSLLVLLNDITDGMNQIKDLEKILSNTNDLSAESKTRKEQIKNDMAAIQQALQERRLRLAELENKLKNSQQYSSTLKKTVENLKAEISNQEATISTLRNDLAAAKIQVDQLTVRVDSLSSTVDSVTLEKQRAEEDIKIVTDELNVCYYAIGSKKELKEAKIIETGFLRKTKLLQADFQQTYFTTADKRTLNSIPTHAKKAKILTNMPEGSYHFDSVDGLQMLNITDPVKFWSLSNYLVIQVD